jgi:hypothetical protein
MDDVFAEFDKNQQVENAPTEAPEEAGESESEDELPEGEPTGDEAASDAIEVEYEDDGGEPVKEKYTKQELAAFVKLSKMSDKDQILMSVAPIMKNITNSKVAQQILQYINEGKTDEELMRGLPELWKPKAEPKKAEEPIPQFATVADEIEWRANQIVEKKLAEKYKSVENLEQNILRERTQTLNRENNDRVLEKALSNLGLTITDVDDEGRKRLTKSFSVWFGNTPVNDVVLSPAQANIIVKDALGRKRQVKTQQIAQQQTKVNGLPIQVPSQIAGEKGGKQPPKTIDNVPREERSKRWDELVFGQK